MSTAKLIQTDKDLLILYYLNSGFPGVSLSGEWMLSQVCGTCHINGHGQPQHSQVGQNLLFHP